MDSFALIKDLLNEARIKYWIDQGTLLRIYRDGQLKTNYKLVDTYYEYDDIDISIFHKEIDKLDNIAVNIAEIGYEIRKCYFKGEIFQFKFLPKNKLNLPPIDVKVYFDSKEDFYWSVKKVIKTPNNKIFHKANKIILSNWYWNSNIVHIDKFPLNLIFKSLTWYLPKNIIEPIQFDNINKMNIPIDIERHLSHHFGNWKEIKNDWKSYRDDKAIIHCHPDVFLNKKKF